MREVSGCLRTAWSTKGFSDLEGTDFRGRRPEGADLVTPGTLTSRRCNLGGEILRGLADVAHEFCRSRPRAGIPSLGAGAVSWRSTRSSSVASSSAEAEIYAGAMAAQELRWLTFLLTDLGERPRSASTLYADNKAMILLC
ncbi:unnamed protein product [Closterium sp. NIES-54]